MRRRIGFSAKEIQWMMGISRQSLHYYRKRGLIIPSLKKAGPGQTSRYSEQDLMQLVVVVILFMYGDTVKDVKRTIPVIKAAIAKQQKDVFDDVMFRVKKSIAAYLTIRMKYVCSTVAIAIKENKKIPLKNFWDIMPKNFTNPYQYDWKDRKRYYESTRG